MSSPAGQVNTKNQLHATPFVAIDRVGPQSDGRSPDIPEAEVRYLSISKPQTGTPAGLGHVLADDHSRIRNPGGSSRWPRSREHTPNLNVGGVL